jgi:hypothetical protein
MRQALAAQRDPDFRDMASSAQMLADAKRAHDFVMWMFGPPSVPQASTMDDAGLRGASQHFGGVRRSIVAARADAPYSPMQAADDANAPPHAPADADQEPALGPAVTNPNIERQGARAQAIAAMRAPAVTSVGGGDLSAIAGAANPVPQPPGDAPLRMVAVPPAVDAMRAWERKPWETFGMLLGLVPLRPSVPVPPPPSYGVVAKNLPPEFRLPPPPLSGWQKPEPDMSWGSPYATALVTRARAGGLDRAVLPSYAPGRERRDAARLFDLFVPGSGNFISGDWNNISDIDLANLGLSLGTTFALGLPGLEGAGELRAAARAAEAAEAARLARVRAAQARLRGPPFVEAPPIVPTMDADAEAEAARFARLSQSVDLDALSARVRQIHGVLDPIAQRFRTTAILSTDGPTFVGGGTLDLSPNQRYLLRHPEEPAKLLDAHAEDTVLSEARNRGYRPRALVTSWQICPKCQPLVRSMGGVISPSGTIAVFPP